MKKTTNYGLTLYEKEDKMNITSEENSLNANMKIIDSELKECNDKIPTKASQLENDKKYADEDYVKNKIAEAQLEGGEVDLSGLATKEELSNKADKTELHNHNNKAILDNITQEDIDKWNSGAGGTGEITGDYQEKLESGVNIKTVNGQEILGEGDLVISSFSTKARYLLMNILKNATYTTSQAQNIEAFNEELLKTDNASSYSITNVLENVTNTNTDIVVDKGASYVATLALADSSYSIREISVMMGGADVTAEVYNSETLTINIPSAFGDIVITAKASNVSIDSLAYKSLTYRDIFMTGNQFAELDFENGLPSYLNINAGTPAITDEDACSGTHSIKCFGTASQQFNVQKTVTVNAGTTFFAALKAKCTRWVKGSYGMQFGDLFSGVTKNTVTEDWITLSYYKKASNDNTVANGFLGSIKADLDAYIDDVVFINVDEVFGEVVPEATIKELYETYIELRKAGV